MYRYLHLNSGTFNTNTGMELATPNSELRLSVGNWNQKSKIVIGSTNGTIAVAHAYRYVTNSEYRVLVQLKCLHSLFPVHPITTMPVARSISVRRIIRVYDLYEKLTSVQISTHSSRKDQSVAA